MPSKKHKPEEIIGKLREVEIVLAPHRHRIQPQAIPQHPHRPKMNPVRRPQDPDIGFLRGITKKRCTSEVYAHPRTGLNRAQCEKVGAGFSQ